MGRQHTAFVPIVADAKSVKKVQGMRSGCGYQWTSPRETGSQPNRMIAGSASHHHPSAVSASSVHSGP